MKLIGHYKRNELALLDFVGGDAEEGVANAICHAANVEVYAPDYDATTSGNTNGWNCLVLRVDLDAWRDAAEAYDAEMSESPTPIETGHFGDGNWRGADLCEDPRDGDAFYWIDLEQY